MLIKILLLLRKIYYSILKSMMAKRIKWPKQPDWGSNENK